MKRKTGARGLRSIMERVLLDTMYLLPDLPEVTKVVVRREHVEQGTQPQFFTADGKEWAAK